MLYIHIPFCKQACSYCNFHFSTSMKTRDAVIDGICKELEMRRPELPAGSVPSVYFGGGTPSLLTEVELGRIFQVLYDNEYLTPPTSGSLNEPTNQQTNELTLEANPDDLDEATIQTLAASPINRLSIGIQSFYEEDLRFMNRAHNATEARSAIKKVNRAGFDDVSIDLIYGGQTTTDDILTLIHIPDPNRPH